MWVQSEVTLHVLVNFFLKIDADGAVSANDLVGADASARSNVAAGVRDADVGGVVTDDVMGALDGCGDEAIGECWVALLGARAGIEVANGSRRGPQRNKMRPAAWSPGYGKASEGGVVQSLGRGLLRKLDAEGLGKVPRHPPLFDVSIHFEEVSERRFL